MPRLQIVIAALCISQTVAAQEWDTSLTLYGQAASLSGKAGVGAATADLDVDFDELLDHLDAAGMMALRSAQERWALSLNAAYSGLDGSAFNEAVGLRASIELEQTLIELRGSMRLNEQVELFGGARFQSVDTQVTVAAGARSRSADRTEDWTDVIVGARAAIPIGRSWRLLADADVGGFGLTSDLTWSALIAADWSVSSSIGVIFGYRALDTDYEDGSGADRFTYDVLIAGPLLGVRWTF